VSDAGDAGISG